MQRCGVYQSPVKEPVHAGIRLRLRLTRPCMGVYRVLALW